MRWQLIKLRNELRDPHGHNEVHLVGGTYYEEFREPPPNTTPDARRCLPIGYGQRSEGIRFPIGHDDPMDCFRESESCLGRREEHTASLKRLVTAYDDGKLTAVPHDSRAA